jgi:hypothetical protein
LVCNNDLLAGAGRRAAQLQLFVEEVESLSLPRDQQREETIGWYCADADRLARERCDNSLGD